MKKGLKIFAIGIGSLLTIIVVAAIIIPVAFKDKIRARIESEINGMLNAKVAFTDYRLSLFKAFPDAAFSLDNLSVTGTGLFEGDTLAAVKSMDIVFNLRSLFGDKAYEIKSVAVNQPLLNAIVLEDGTANWDIIKETPEDIEADTLPEAPFKVQLREVSMSEGRLFYTDRESDMAASLEDMKFNLSGNMSASQTDLEMDISAGRVDFIMDKIKYLTDAKVNYRAGIDANLDSMIFVLKDNALTINGIVLNLAGSVAMPGDDISADLEFNAPETSFKSLLSLIPSFYMTGYEELKASGTFSLDGTLKGIYSSADSTMPDITVRLLVNDGVISYPDLPEKITAINIKGEVKTGGNDMDNTTVDLSRFHFELAGNPFDMTMKLSTPISDPAVIADVKGKIDLAKLQQAMPLDSISLNGLIDVSLALAGRMSMLENKKYDQFKAEGALVISDMAVEMTDMPDIKISTAAFNFNPAFAELKQLQMTVGEKSDFTASGRLENYIPYLFSGDTIRGHLSMASNNLDLNEILDIMPSDTTENDTASLAVIQVPKDIDFIFDAAVKRLVFDKLTGSDVRGKVVVKEGVITVSEAAMKTLGGTLLANAVYDTRDTLRPAVSADLLISMVTIKDAFNAFNTVQKLAPAAAGLGGNVTVGMKYKSLLGSNMMPVISTITGGGEMHSESLQILESKTFDQIKNVLKLNQKYTNIIKDFTATFAINDGRLFIKPFDTKIGNIKLNISGDQGLDQTLNFVVRTEIPRSELGDAAGALMGALAAQAATMGMNLTPPEIIKVNLKIGGTFLKPVITPLFAGSEGVNPVTTVTEAVKEEVTEKVNEEAKAQADKILKEAEEQAKVLREEAASSAKAIRTEADLQGKKLIKDAEPKGTIAVMVAKKGAEALNKEADKRATQLETEANTRADKLLADAKAKADELLK
ncbi:MAG: AsmA-like C-terminal region-containing protein [Bacteroidales bacterium]